MKYKVGDRVKIKRNLVIPQICKILGVDIGQEFNIKGFSENPYYIEIKDEKRIRMCNTHKRPVMSELLITIINNPELIEIIPKFNDNQKNLLKAFKCIGFNYITKDSDYIIVLWEFKPCKNYHDDCWDSKIGNYFIISDTNKAYNILKKIVSWKDEEPFKIREDEVNL